MTRRRGTGSRGPGGRATTPTWGQLRARLWFWPLLGVVLSVVVTLGLLQVRPRPESLVARLVWPTGSSTASSLLQTVATASITAATLSFSLTVVALQLASQQFSPRLLREFARDAVIQTAMAVLLSAFVVALLTLRGVESGRPLPVLALLFALLLGLASAVALLLFVGHIVRSLRVDQMMARVHTQTRATVLDSYPPRGQGGEDPGPELPGPEGGTLVPAWRSGFVRAVHPEPLVAVARQQGVLVRLGLRPGDSVVSGAPVASVWSDDGGPVDVDALVGGLREAVVLGFERTEEQDVGFGFRQLVDIGVKAISPGVNDPTTCAETLGYCADLLVLLLGRRLGAQLERDDEGAPRVVLPDRDHAYYLDMVCAQPRRYGSREPAVLGALLRLLRDCAVAARDDAQRALVEEQVEAVLAEMADDLLPRDRDSVLDAARRTRLALRGDLDAAYRDRAGETRSI